MKKYKIIDRYLNLPVFIGDKRLVTFYDFYIPDNSVEAVKIIEKKDLQSGKARVIEVFVNKFSG